jgi:hypothetical protein
MKSIFLVLLCGIFALNMSQCQRFPASADSLYTKAVSLVETGCQLESESFQQALQKYEQAQALLETLQRRFPTDPLAIQIASNHQPIGPLKNQKHLEDLLRLTQERAKLENNPDAFFRAYGHDLCEGLAFYAKKGDSENFQLLVNKFEWAEEELIQNLIHKKINEKQLPLLVEMIRATEQDSSRNALEVWGSILLQQNEIDDARALYEVLLTKSKMVDTGLFTNASWQNEVLSSDPELIKSKDRLSLKLVEYYLGKQKEDDAREILPNIIQAPLQHKAMTQMMQYWEKHKLLSPDKMRWLLDHALPASNEWYPLLDVNMEQIVKGTITIGSSTKDFGKVFIFKEVQPFLIRLEESKERSRKNDSYQLILFLIEKLGSWSEYRPELQGLIAKVYPSEGFPDKSHKKLFEPLMSSFAYPSYLQVLSEIDNESWKRDAIQYLVQNDPGIKTLEQARSVVNLLSNPEQQQEAWNKIVINWAKNQSEEQCLIAIQQLPNTALMAHAYLEMLRSWGEIGQAEKAKSYLNQALSLIDSVNTAPDSYFAPPYESFEEARKAIRQQAYVLLLLLEDSEEAEKIRATYALDVPYQEILRHVLWMLQTEKHEQLWKVCQQFPGLFNDSSAFDAFHADLLLLLSDFQQNTLFEDYFSMLPVKPETSPFEESNSNYQEVKQLILKSDHEQALIALNKIQDIHWKSKALAEYYLHFQENSSAISEDFKKTLHLILVVLVR